MIDDLLRDLAKKGKLNHITMIIQSDGKFSAAYRDQVSPGYCMFADKDPVVALETVLKNKGYKSYPGATKEDADEAPKPLKKKRDLLG